MSYTPQERELLLGPDANDTQVISWSGRLSAQGCPSDSPVAEAGTYRVRATVSTAPAEGEGEAAEQPAAELTGEATFTVTQASDSDDEGSDGGDPDQG